MRRFLAEEAAGERVEGALQVAHADALIDGKALDLGEHPLMRGVRGLLAVALAGDDDAHGRFGLFHDADLVRGGVRAEQHRALAIDEGVDPDRVPHITGGVVVGDADGIEVVARPLDLGALEDAEAHLREGVDAVVHGLRDGVEAAQGLGTAPGG